MIRRKGLGKRASMSLLAGYGLEKAYERLVEKYGYRFKGNRPMDFDAFVRFATSKEAEGICSVVDLLEKYLTWPKDELKFDRSERRRKEKYEELRKVVEDFCREGRDDEIGNDISESSLTISRTNPEQDSDRPMPDASEGQDCDDIADYERFGCAEYEGQTFVLCEGLDWNGGYSAHDCWVHAVPIDAQPKFDTTYSCVLLHFRGHIGYGTIYQAVGCEDSDDLFCLNGSTGSLIVQ